MQRGLILFLLLISTITNVYGYELILPKDKNSTVNTNYILFLGKANNTENITINNEKVFTSSNGAFAHSIKLKDGENRILVRSNFNTQVYKVCKKTKNKKEEIKLNEFEIKPAIIKKDNTPLRNTPINSGMNRISHLFKNTTILINGEFGEFYKVFLSKDKEAWIAKEDVEFIDTKNSQIGSFINMDSKKYSNAQLQTISFTKNLPYTIEDYDKEILFKIYNPELSQTSFYTLNIPKPEKYTYKISLDDGTYTFKVNEIPKNIEEYTIIIDAGHGGSEKGAIGGLGDKEKDINLKIALELEKILKAQNINVLLTRECDGNVDLATRVDFAKKNEANIFVSIHLNSIGDTQMNIHKMRGTSIYYYNKHSKPLAEILEKTVTKSAGTKRNGIHTASFAVLRPTEYISVLVEAAYMINPLDTVLYKKEDFAKNVADGIANGIIEFITKN